MSPASVCCIHCSYCLYNSTERLLQAELVNAERPKTCVIYDLPGSFVTKRANGTTSATAEPLIHRIPALTVAMVVEAAVRQSQL